MLIWCRYRSPSQLPYPSSVIDTLDADHVTFRGGGRRVGGGRGGWKDFLHMTTAGKKNPTRSVNRKKNNVTQGKKLWMHMSQEKVRAPQKFNGPLLSKVT